MRTVARLVVVGWLLAALAVLAMGGRLGVFCALATPGTLLTVAAGVLIRQQRAPSMLEGPLLPERYRMADDLHQPLAAVVAAAEEEAHPNPVAVSGRRCASTPLRTEGVPVSQRDSVHTGIKLPDLATCGGLCAAFPACLPPLPPTAEAELVRRLEGSMEEARVHLRFLTTLRAALDDDA